MVKRGRYETRIAVGILLIAAALADSRPAHAQTFPDDVDLNALQSLLAASTTDTLEASFRCEKRILSLDTPLRSAGQLIVARHSGRISLRLSTESPYISELILADGKSRAHSQHESAWTTSDQSSRPGMAAVMVLIAGCCAGEPGNLPELFTVRAARDDELPSKPEAPTQTWFVLEPSNKDLALAVRQLKLGFSRTGPTPRLTDAIIETAQGDTTHYDFFNAKPNATLPADAFKPINLHPETTPRPEGGP
jgi:hypothetical protein